jgi:hypothetical protein
MTRKEGTKHTGKNEEWEVESYEKNLSITKATKKEICKKKRAK